MDDGTYIETHIARIARAPKVVPDVAGTVRATENWRKLSDVILDLRDALASGRVKLDY